MKRRRKTVIDPPARLAAAEETSPSELIYGMTTEILKSLNGRHGAHARVSAAPRLCLGSVLFSWSRLLPQILWFTDQRSTAERGD